MSEYKEVKPIIKGWYSVKFKSSLSKSDRKEQKLAASFIDFAEFDGNDWDISEYRQFGFYVSDVIKLQ